MPTSDDLKHRDEFGNYLMARLSCGCRIPVDHLCAGQVSRFAFYQFCQRHQQSKGG